MSRSVAVRVLLACSLIATIFTGCSRDPAVKKQKYLEGGDKYFAEGKYREARIQYENALQIDANFAPAHSQLAQTYLKLGDTNRAFQELNKTVELAPDNYRAHTDIANLLVTGRNADGSPVQDYLKQAKIHLDLLREKVPNSPETHEAWANYYSAQNNLASAIQEAQSAIAADPSRSESYLLLALFQLRANLPERCRDEFQEGDSG